MPLDKNHRRDFSCEEIAQAIVEWRKANPTSCYLQITGGEPILNDLRTDEMVTALIQADSVAQSELRIIYQTNGSFIGKTNRIPASLSNLRSLRRTAILFELSIKGTNLSEYAILSGSGKPEGFYDQCRAYWLLKGLISNNISVVARLGCGHHRNTIHFVNPESGCSMFLHES